VKTALIFGSTGLVGGNVLNQLIQNDNYSKIKIFVRSSIQVNNSKVQVIQTDFNNLEKHKEEIMGSECFYCIGTTKKNSFDKNEYQRIELDIPKQVAQIAKSNNINSYFFVSSGYANSKSSGDYLKYKGLVEEEILSLGFSKIGIMRPSFILGNRKEFRLGEKIGIIIFKLLNPIFIGPLKKMRSIHSETIARAMIKIANEDIDRKIFESDQISELVK
tara:strand:+ start:29 stop:682 length:654 start_codon:yes stop_codon:yes gene_type:complete